MSQVHFKLDIFMKANNMNNLEKRDPSEIERTYNIKKTADSFFQSVHEN